jgi:hypothetical protein
MLIHLSSSSSPSSSHEPLLQEAWMGDLLRVKGLIDARELLIFDNNEWKED